MSLAVKSSRAALIAQRPTVRRAGMRGDPGIFGDIWSGIKGVGGAIVGGATGLLTGGPLGAIGGAVRGSGILGDPKPPALPAIGNVPFINPRQGLQQAPTGVSVGGLFPGGAKPYAALDYTNGNGHRPGSKEGLPSGYHWNKSDYFLKDGTFVAAGTQPVKDRRRNPMNPRALSNSMKRLEGAKRFQAKLSGFSTPKYTAAGNRKKC